MSIEGQGHFFTIYFPGFVCFVLSLAKISGERLQDHCSSEYYMLGGNLGSLLYGDVSMMHSKIEKNLYQYKYCFECKMTKKYETLVSTGGSDSFLMVLICL